MGMPLKVNKCQSLLIYTDTKTGRGERKAVRGEGREGKGGLEQASPKKTSPGAARAPVGHIP